MVKYLKKIVTYHLLILVLFSYNYKTINYYFKLTDGSIVFTQNYDCEEKNAESKNSDEKKDFSEHMPYYKTHPLILNSPLSFSPKWITRFVSSDYSLTVYSPPDLATV
jgi:hypothetical protein